MNNIIDHLGHEFVNLGNHPSAVGPWAFCKNCSISFNLYELDSRFNNRLCKEIHTAVITHNFNKNNFKCTICEINSLMIESYIYTCNEYLMIKANE